MVLKSTTIIPSLTRIIPLWTRSMLMPLLSIELVLCLLFSCALAISDNGDALAFIFQIWLICVITRIIITLTKFDTTSRKVLAFVFIAMLIVSTVPGALPSAPYYHQNLFIAGTTSLIFLFGTSLPRKHSQNERLRGWVQGVLLILALPIAVQIWSIANIGFLYFAARNTAHTDAACVLVKDDKNIFNYRQSNSSLDLLGLTLYVPYTNAGGSGSFQWTFHALLVTKSRPMFNWSYQSQRFEPLTEQNSFQFAKSVRCEI
jgi:hypothetical protein